MLLLQTITLPVLICWSIFSLWALLFGMTITGGLGLIIIPLLLQPWLPKSLSLRLNLWGAIVPLIMWQIGWIEYRNNRIRLGCKAHQVYHALHTDIPNWCPAQYQTSLDDWEPISLYKPSERVAIWLHHLGESWYLYFNGFKQLSKQLRRLQTASPTLPSIGPSPPKQLRSACNPQGPKNGTLIQLQSTKLTQTKGWQEWQNNNAEALSELESWEHIQRPLLHTQPVKPHSLSSILRHHATVSLNKSRLVNTWSVTQPILHTMTSAYAYELDWVLLSLNIPIDDSLYCGLQMDSWLFPYREQWNWTEKVSN